MAINETILVTGINGYLASHIGLQLLEKGYTVRGTSRSLSAKQHLLDGAFKGYDAQYEHSVIPDMTAPGAFDEAVAGVNAIIHTASPVHFNGTTVEEYFGPATGGVLSILESTKTSSLKAFILTSSIAAITDRWKNPADHRYTEEDWNTSGEAVARATFSAPVAYGASKAIAERAMWDWKTRNQPSFSMSAIQPGVIMGPPISFPNTPRELNATLEPVWQLYSGEAKVMPPQIGYAGYIDVRDVAGLHVWCMEHMSDGRYLIANGKAPPQAVADILRKRYPNREILVGKPGEGYVDGYGYPPGEPDFTATKAYNAMGVDRFRGAEEMIVDTIEAFEKRWPGLADNEKKSN